MKIKSGPLKGWEISLTDKKGKQLGEHRLHYHRSHDVLPAYSRLYVECKDGLEFKIIVRRPTLQSRLECQVDIRIDGRYHELMVFAKNVKTFQHGMMTEMEDNIPYRRPFMFSTLSRSEDGMKLPEDRLLELGKIEISFALGRLEAAGEWEEEESTSQKVVDTLHEKTKQLHLTSYVRGGPSRKKVGRQTSYHFTPMFGVFGPQSHKVTFTYCTRAAPEALEIVSDPDKPPSKRGSNQPKRPQRSSSPLAVAEDGDDIIVLEPKRKARSVEIIDITSDDEPTSGEPPAKALKMELLEKENDMLRNQLQKVKDAMVPINGVTDEQGIASTSALFSGGASSSAPSWGRGGGRVRRDEEDLDRSG